VSRRFFSEGDLLKALTDVGNHLTENVRVYLIGGCAMTFIGRKAATKDIDVVLTSPRQVELFLQAAELVGFKRVEDASREYESLGAWNILENEDGMRFDMFDRQACKCLTIDAGMESRARLYRRLGLLEVYLMAPEDIFLFKGITERESDLDDLRVLVEYGVDWQTVEGECLSQGDNGVWTYRLYSKLLELRRDYGIESPILRRLRDHSDLELIKRLFTEVIGKRKMSFNEIAQAILNRTRYSSSWTRSQLRMLVSKDAVRIEKTNRRVLYYISSSVDP